MADIKKGFKRIERVLIVLGVVGVVLGVLVSVAAYVFGSMQNWEFIFSLALLIPVCFSPYLVYKFIYWIVMGFVDDDE